MARKVIDIGAVGNDGTGDSVRESFRKVNDNFRELYSSLGLGERLLFIEMDDTPDEYFGQENAVLAVNATTDGLVFKQIEAGIGIIVDNVTNPNQIRISTEFSEISNDPSPQLGGNLSARFGGEQYRIQDLTAPLTSDEAANKGYADQRVSRTGVDSIDTDGTLRPEWGVMTGPLILSRDPEPEDDERYEGKIAATKAYVDSSAFGSSVNLYVATSGQDERPGVSDALQGRALAYAYRTLESALKKAEEILLESPLEIGPYKKLLTYNEGQGICTLTKIEESPDSGVGFIGSAIVSVDTITINTVGTGFNSGDIFSLSGGSGEVARYRVLAVERANGPIRSIQQISAGRYTAIPGSSAVTITRETGIGIAATFNVTYKVVGINILNGGTGYSLVSVRVTGSGGTGAFGIATVDAGVITDVEITDQGSGFTSIPNVTANLPRFFLKTEGFRTDFTGDVTTDTPEAIRGRDIREGLFIRGETSGALGQILAHSGALSAESDTLGDEIFDIDIKFGNFQIGEPISYGDVANQTQITVLVESGIYEENYPLKVPQNVAIVGDEFRRVLIRPRPGTSSSPWSFQKFRRDPVIDGMQVTDRLFGYHYLHDTSQPVYPRINNKGNYKDAAQLIKLNKLFITSETIAWIDRQIELGIAPYTTGFQYESRELQTYLSVIVDSIVFDLKYGEYNRTISTALKFYQDTVGTVFITTQLSQTLAAIDKVQTLIQSIIDNTTITPVFQVLNVQVVDTAYVSESGADTVVGLLIAALNDVIDGSGSVNYPEENDKLDVFLCNDSVILRAMTMQGHGGFSMVLDPTGQILAKSPYAQECASFSKSIDSQTFAGGMFVDGFAGNLQFQITSKISNTRLVVGSLDRLPQLPASYIVDDAVYRINYIRDYVYNPNGSTAVLVLDETTPWTREVFSYNESICRRDVGLILDGLGYDLIFGTNYHARKAGLYYRLINAAEVIENQQSITIRAIEFAHDLAAGDIAASFTELVDLSSSEITTIIRRGPFYASALSFTNPPSLASNSAAARTLLESNLNFIRAEAVGYMNSTYPALAGFNSTTFSRDMGFIIEALIYDIIYGGNSQTVDAGLKYYDGVGSASALQIPAGILSETVDGIDYVKYLAKQVIVNAAPASTYSTVPQITGSASDSAIQAIIETLLTATSAIVAGGPGSAPTITLPDLNAYAYDNDSKTARTQLQNNKASIQNDVITFIDENANLYEVLMPGNRSMLSNDFTQVADMGYGLIATNGGLTEAVSMFTYYCYTSYYSINGGQIRSIGGSSSHGIYALVAEGSDPLEVPTPTELYYELAQRVDCYFPSGTYANNAEGLFIFVTNYDYEPLGNSELEIDHGYVIYRYPVTSVSTTGLPAGVTRLNLTSDDTGNFEGLFAQVPDGTKMSLRSNSQVILTGDLVDVAVRPSTGLVLAENPEVYRVLQFESYDNTKGPYEVTFTVADPTAIRVLITVTSIATNVCTTSQTHGLIIGDTFTAQSTANGFVDETTYYVISVPNYNEFTVSTTPGGSTHTLSNGSGLSIKGIVPHKLNAGFTISFESTVSLPTGITAGTTYYVLSDGLADTTFGISTIREGTPVEVTLAGSGTLTYITEGLTKTTLRENYNYVDLTVFQPGELVSSTTTCTITITDPVVIQKTGHGLSAGDVIRFFTTGELPNGLSESRNYYVFDDSDPNEFTISTIHPSQAGATETGVSGSQSGTQSYGLVTGRVGDTSFAVVPVAPEEESRVLGTKLLFLGEEYTILNYANTTATGDVYARVTLNRALEDSIIQYGAGYTVKSAVPVRSLGAEGTLTIRIALTRVTSHDLLEIGTGSYADTNYPNEIFGPAVNALNEEGEVQERDVGRVFYVTTDQFGNFKVGPYFKVDQGTGRVTFSAAIALSNLDGIGFKRGVPIAEFSVDGTMGDNAVDTVPTENATRVYIERRLGTTHGGSPVDPEEIIPSLTGGFMALTGVLAMKSNMNLGNNKIIQLADPTVVTDAVNLRSLTLNNTQDLDLTNLRANDLLVFTGDGSNAINARIVGDISLDIDSTANTLDAQITPGSILNADVNSSAAIAQSKLSMNAATTRANATGIAQSDRGLASFNSDQFTATDGWITVKDNGIVLTKIAQIAGKSVLANNSAVLGNITAVGYATITADGGAIRKLQYTTTGFLRRSGATSTSDGDYQVIDTAAAYTGATENGKLINRDTNGDFGARVANLQKLQIDSKDALDTSTTASGGYLQVYTWGGSGGIFLQDGSLAADKKNAYWNDLHQFKTQNGVSDAPITCLSIQTGTLTTGGPTTPGTVTGAWSLSAGSTFQATYSADLAEYYMGDKEYVSGSVLVFGGDEEVTTSNTANDTRVAGIVSTNPAYIMNSHLKEKSNSVCIALQGRVPCKVVGKIKKGDLLVTSGISGVATAATVDVKIGSVIGKSLENYDSDHIGMVEVAVGR